MATHLTTIPGPVSMLLKLDSHTHIYTNYRPIANRRGLELGPRTLEWLTQTVIKNGVNAVGITNFNDKNYEFWTSQTKDLPKGWGFYQDDRLTAVDNPGAQDVVYFFKSEEIATQEGHILLFGTKRGSNIPHGLSLEETLNIAHEDPISIKIADHPFSKFAPSLNEKIEKYSNLFDAYEFNAATDGNDETEAQAVYDRGRLQDTKPLIASSDSHSPGEIGRSYINLLSAMFSHKSGKEVVCSIRDLVRQNAFEAEKQQSPIGFSIKHMGLNLFYNIVLKRINPAYVDPNCDN